MPTPTFIPYQKDQLRLLLLDLGEMVQDDHLVRMVDMVIDSIDTTSLVNLFPHESSPMPVMEANRTEGT